MAMECRERARRMLSAWNSGRPVEGVADRERFVSDSGEQERSELLEGIQESLNVGGLRTSVSLRLLRRLAAAN